MGRPGRRHYRVAQKEVETCSHECSCQDKKKVIAVIALVCVAAFLKGFVIGHLVSRNND